jgi:hypothetical protein
MQKVKKTLNTRAFQQVPRHMRRRTASHNAKKVPRRLRKRAEREVGPKFLGQQRCELTELTRLGR